MGNFSKFDNAESVWNMDAHMLKSIRVNILDPLDHIGIKCRMAASSQEFFRQYCGLLISLLNSISTLMEVGEQEYVLEKIYSVQSDLINSAKKGKSLDRQATVNVLDSVYRELLYVMKANQLIFRTYAHKTVEQTFRGALGLKVVSKCVDYIDNLDMLSQAFVDVSKSDKDVICLVTGWTGEGKSMLVQRLIADYICPYLDIPYDLDKYMFLSDSADEFADLWVNNPRYSAIQVDESIDLFFSGDWTKKSSKDLQKSATKSRGLNKIVFLLVPDMMQMTKYFRDRRARCWIHVVERGNAVVFTRTKNFASTDAWGLEKLNRILANRKTVRSIVLGCSKLDTYCFNLKFGKWDSPLFEKYLKKKVLWNSKKISKSEQALSTDMEISKKMYEANMRGISQQKIAEMFNMKQSSVSERIKKYRTIKEKPY